MKFTWTGTLLGLVLLLVTAGCTGAPPPAQQSGVATFLQQFALKTEGEPEQFTVKVPQSRAVPMGA
jgi:hypothetical protein